MIELLNPLKKGLSLSLPSSYPIKNASTFSIPFSIPNSALNKNKKYCLKSVEISAYIC